MSYDQHMPPPDWLRTMVHPDQKKKAVGDPTLWGNSVRVPIDEAGPYDGTSNILYTSPQIILAQAADHYTRSWSITGTVTAPTDAWEDPALWAPPDILIPPEGGGPRLSVYLAVLQGTEKITIEHMICLVYGGDTGNRGLCNNQSSKHGGPYLPSVSSDFLEQTRPFAAIGALIGNTVTVRALIVRGNGGGSIPGVVPSVTIAAMVTPYAPGAGI